MLELVRQSRLKPGGEQSHGSSNLSRGTKVVKIVGSYTEQELREVVAKSTTSAEVLRYFGLVPRGGNYGILKKKLKEFAICTEHFLGNSWAKGKPGNRKLQNDLEIVLVKGRLCNSSKLRQRLIREGLLEAKCIKCGIFEWMGQPAPLELEHKNGDNTDNRLENLEILCPNCHAQTPTCRGRNRTNSRKSQRF